MSQRIITDDSADHVGTTDRAQIRHGRDVARRRRHRDAVVRIREFQRWLKHGCPRGEMPRMPSQADYRIMRGGR